VAWGSISKVGIRSIVKKLVPSANRLTFLG